MTEQLSPERASDDHASTLYAKLLGETAPIAWQELQPFFARGVVLWVAAALDLIAVALAVAEDDKASISAWLAADGVMFIRDAASVRLWLSMSSQNKASCLMSTFFIFPFAAAKSR